MWNDVIVSWLITIQKYGSYFGEVNNEIAGSPAVELSRSHHTTTSTQTQFITTEGGRVAFEDTGGNGPAILAIPGMGDLRAEYRLIRPALQQAGYRVITMDARGFGETSAKWSDFSARAVGRDAVAVLKHLGVGPATIMGNSFAAGSALWAAQDAPAEVNGVVLLGPIVRDPLILSGITLNMASLAGTTLALFALTGDKGISGSLASLTLPTITIPIVDGIPILGPLLSGHHILTHAGLLAVPLVAILVNITPAAEGNIWGDPLAADEVTGAAWPLTMVGLDVTQRTRMPTPFPRALASEAREAGRFIWDISRFYEQFHLNGGLDSIYVHDSSAVAYLLNPELFETRRGSIRVVSEGLAFGQTIQKPEGNVFPPGAWDDRPEHHICTDVDPEGLRRLYRSMLRLQRS